MHINSAPLILLFLSAASPFTVLPNQNQTRKNIVKYTVMDRCIATSASLSSLKYLIDGAIMLNSEDDATLKNTLNTHLAILVSVMAVLTLFITDIS
ncbi:MAG: hypothetical protein ACI955_000568 [Zhongshania sp.]|jgi:hypothetical protein